MKKINLLCTIQFLDKRNELVPGGIRRHRPGMLVTDDPCLSMTKVSGNAIHAPVLCALPSRS